MSSIIDYFMDWPITKHREESLTQYIFVELNWTWRTNYTDRRQQSQMFSEVRDIISTMK